MQKPWRVGLIVVALLALGVLLYDRVPMMKWVGSTSLTIDFVVTDEETGQPIEGAVLLLHAESDKHVLGKEPDFRFHTDQDGVARHVIPHITCVGTQSNLRFTDTRAVYTPDWVILGVTAPGYQQSDSFSLSDSRYRRMITSVGPSQDQLVVPIALRKSAP